MQKLKLAAMHLQHKKVCQSRPTVICDIHSIENKPLSPYLWAYVAYVASFCKIHFHHFSLVYSIFNLIICDRIMLLSSLRDSTNIRVHLHTEMETELLMINV